MGKKAAKRAGYFKHLEGEQYLSSSLKITGGSAPRLAHCGPCTPLKMEALRLLSDIHCQDNCAIDSTVLGSLGELSADTNLSNFARTLADAAKRLGQSPDFEQQALKLAQIALTLSDTQHKLENGTLSLVDEEGSHEHPTEGMFSEALTGLKVFFAKSASFFLKADNTESKSGESTPHPKSVIHPDEALGATLPKEYPGRQSDPGSPEADYNIMGESPSKSGPGRETVPQVGVFPIDYDRTFPTSMKSTEHATRHTWSEAHPEAPDGEYAGADVGNPVMSANLRSAAPLALEDSSESEDQPKKKRTPKEPTEPGEAKTLYEDPEFTQRREEAEAEDAHLLELRQEHRQEIQALEVEYPDATPERKAEIEKQLTEFGVKTDVRESAPYQLRPETETVKQEMSRVDLENGYAVVWDIVGHSGKQWHRVRGLDPAGELATTTREGDIVNRFERYIEIKWGPAANKEAAEMAEGTFRTYKDNLVHGHKPEIGPGKERKPKWDAAYNTPTLADATGQKGTEYVVSATGTQDLGSGNISFNKGDKVRHDGTAWRKKVKKEKVKDDISYLKDATQLLGQPAGPGGGKAETKGWNTETLTAAMLAFLTKFTEVHKLVSSDPTAAEQVASRVGVPYDELLQEATRIHEANTAAIDWDTLFAEYEADGYFIAWDKSQYPARREMAQGFTAPKDIPAPGFATALGETLGKVTRPQEWDEGTEGALSTYLKLLSEQVGHLLTKLDASQEGYTEEASAAFMQAIDNEFVAPYNNVKSPEAPARSVDGVVQLASQWKDFADAALRSEFAFFNAITTLRQMGHDINLVGWHQRSEPIPQALETPLPPDIILQDKVIPALTKLQGPTQWESREQVQTFLEEFLASASTVVTAMGRGDKQILTDIRDNRNWDMDAFKKSLDDAVFEATQALLEPKGEQDPLATYIAALQKAGHTFSTPLTSAMRGDRAVERFITSTLWQAKQSHLKTNTEILECIASKDVELRGILESLAVTSHVAPTEQNFSQLFDYVADEVSETLPHV